MDERRQVFLIPRSTWHEAYTVTPDGTRGQYLGYNEDVPLLTRTLEEHGYRVALGRVVEHLVPA